MGQRFLIDTNILIYLVKLEIPEDKTLLIQKIIESSFNISLVTKIEFLGWNKHTIKGLLLSKDLISKANIIDIDNTIADQAIEIKQKTNLKLGDSVIAATTLINNLTLVSRNTKDFTKVPDLKLYNPFETT